MRSWLDSRLLTGKLEPTRPTTYKKGQAAVGLFVCVLDPLPSTIHPLCYNLHPLELDTRWRSIGQGVAASFSVDTDKDSKHRKRGTASAST